MRTTGSKAIVAAAGEPTPVRAAELTAASLRDSGKFKDGRLAGRR